MSMAVARRLKKAVRKNKKGTPKLPARIGATTRLRAKVSPMEAPIFAKALVLTSSLVRSAERAIMAEETAPKPCTKRAKIILHILPAIPPIKLPTA